MTGRTFVCLYCGKAEPEAFPSRGHIFPDALGGVTATTDTVCTGCNNLVNQRVENPVLRDFDFFRSIWGLTGRKRGALSVSAKMRLPDGSFAPITLDHRGHPRSPVISQERHADGHSTVTVIGEGADIDRAKADLAKRRKYHWRDSPTTKEFDVLVPFGSDSDSLLRRRLAAKIALEWWANLRGGSRTYEDLGDVREFVLNGVENRPIAGLVSDDVHLREFMAFGPGYNFVWIHARPPHDGLWAIVAIFSLYYYWVALSPEFSPLAMVDEPLFENGQDRTTETPLLRSGLAPPVMPWTKWVARSLHDAAGVKKAALSLALKKVNASRTRRR